MPGPAGLVVALSGSAGSGKSTLAAGLAKRLGGSSAAFGDYVRHLADRQGAEHSRETLQEIGQRAVSTDPQAFVDAFIRWVKPNPLNILVVDGVRHVTIGTALRMWAGRKGRPYLAVHVAASAQSRAQRRTGGDLAALERIDAHAVERESITDLPTLADVIVDSERATDEAITTICHAIDVRNRL